MFPVILQLARKRQLIVQLNSLILIYNLANQKGEAALLSAAKLFPTVVGDLVAAFSF